MDVLIVGGDRHFRHALAARLQARGHATAEIADGFSALKRVCAPPHPDLVLLDLALPGLDGRTVCRCIVENPTTRGIPLVVIGDTAAEHPEDLLELGAACCVARRATDAVLADLDRVLDRLASGDLLTGAGLLGTDGLHARRAVRDLVHERRALEQVLGGMTFGVIVSDRHARITVANPAARRALGLPSCGILGREVAEILGVDPRRARRGPFEVEVCRGDRALRIHGSLLASGPDGERLLFTIEDVTDRRRADEQRAELERRAAVGGLVGGVAHEFLNLLAAVHGVAEKALLLTESMPSDLRRDFESILAVAGRGTEITRGLVDFSRGVMASEPRSLDPRESVEQVIGMLATRLHRMRIRVLREHDPDLPSIRVHEGRLLQILLNLMRNAMDAAGPEGWIRVRLRASMSCVILEVTDSGPGIPPENLERIFQPFYTTKVGSGASGSLGAGLGLSESRRMATEMRGALTASNTPSAGATFRLTLPGEASVTDVAGTPAAEA